MAEIVTGLRHLRSLLSADTTLMAAVTQVYADVAPLDAVYPFVVVAYQDGADELGVGGEYILSGLTYSVRVVGRGASFLPLETIAARVKTVLHKTTGAVGNGNVWECLQTAPLAYAEDGVDGQQYRHLGGLYELVVRG